MYGATGRHLGDVSLGNVNAPVTVIEYVSLTCPHCAHFQKALFPRFKKEFIDTGKIRFIVREFPIGHTSGTAAIINRCAPEDKYFSLFNAFLLRQPEWVSQEVRPDAIYSVAKSSGMSRETFDKCLSNQTIIDGLTEVKQRGRQFGVIGTPTFLAFSRSTSTNNCGTLARHSVCAPPSIGSEFRRPSRPCSACCTASGSLGSIDPTASSIAEGSSASLSRPVRSSRPSPRTPPGTCWAPGPVTCATRPGTHSSS